MKFEDKRPNLRELVVTAKECTEAQELFFTEAINFAQEFLGKRYSSIQEATREDIAQRAMMRAFRSFHQIVDSECVYGWLEKILVRQVANWSRTERQREQEFAVQLSGLKCPKELTHDPSDQGKGDPLTTLLTICEHQDYTVVFNMLTEVNQQVLGLRYGQELSYEEIAGKLNIGIGTVRSRIHNARKSLKKIVEEFRAYENEVHK